MGVAGDGDGQQAAACRAEVVGGLGLGCDQGRPPGAGNAQWRRSLETGHVQHQDCSEFAGRLEAGGAPKGVDVHAAATQRSDLDRAEVESTAVHATALVVQDADERLDHLGRVAHGEFESDPLVILEAGAQVDDPDGLLCDPVVGGTKG